MGRDATTTRRADNFSQARPHRRRSGVLSRNYDPTTGTFLTRDPLEEPAGTTVHTNPYAYVRNDPLNRVDPLGTRSCDADFGTAGGINNLRFDAEERQDPLPGAESLYEEAQKQDRCLLFYNGNDHGRAGLVVGSLQSRHVMIQMAATDTDLGNFTDKFLDRARTIQTGQSDLAVISYLGYVTPGFSSVWRHHIEDSDDKQLRDLITALRSRGKHVTLLANSWAAQVALRLDSQNANNVEDLILWNPWSVGSTSAWDYPSDREWMGQSEGDKSPYGIEGAAGMREFSTEGASGHGDMSGQLLENVRRIATQRYGQVTCAGGGDGCISGLRRE